MPPAAPSLRLEYAREPDVSERLDGELRELISGCFPQAHNAFFRDRRYAQEMLLHRYLLRGTGDRLLAHVAVHEKRISVAGAELLIGGMAEVCVHESQRGKGHARRLLDEAHRGLRARDVAYALLFGEPELYASSGYSPLLATIRRFDPAQQAFHTATSRVALCKPLTDRPWPDGPIDLRGPLF